MTSPTSFRLDGVETSLQRKGIVAKLGWTTVLLLGLLFLLEMIFEAMGVAWRPFVTGLTMMLIGSQALMLTAIFLHYFRWKGPGSIAVEGSALVLERSGHDRLIPLSDLTAGHTSPLHKTVELTLRGGDVVHVHVPSNEEGQRLLEATGLDAARRTMRMRLGETWFLDALSILGGSWLVEPIERSLPFTGLLTLALTVVLTIALLRAVRVIFGPAELVIGADGIIVQQRGRSRFLPFSQIASVEASGAATTLRYAGRTPPVLITLTDGSVIKARTRHLLAAQREELAARIADARRAFEQGDAGAGARLERQGRSAEAWREALRALTAPAESYRAQAGLDPEALTAVLESPGAPVERRIGAAIALAAGGDPEARARVRVAAEACANERVRIALARAAEDALDDEVIEAAIAEERAAR